MSPPRRLPELVDDVIEEILLRLPPDDPRCLFRASLVCKPWRRLLTDAAFLGRYRRFHRTPPLLGLFFVGDHNDGSYLPFFVPTTPAASPFPQPMLNCRPWFALDCRHGRVLLQRMLGSKLIVWNPITGDRKELDQPCFTYTFFSAAVLCAAAGCDHVDCHGGPFLVVWVYRDIVDATEESAQAWVYSSQAGSWCTPVSVPVGVSGFISATRGALAGDAVYFILRPGSMILEYDLAKHRLSVIDPPESYMNGIFVPTEDGLLGVAGIKGSCLYLWSRKANAEGVEGWMQYRVIDLQTLLPDVKLLHEATVIGFAEGVRVIFVDTCAGISVIDLNSEQARIVSSPGTHLLCVPFTSFYTPGCACGKLPIPAETS